MKNETTQTPEQRHADKAMNFKRVAEKRVPKVIKAIRGLHPLASPNYAYTPEQARKILTALEAELIGLGTVLERKKQTADVEFSL
jgi:hypothetical protein